MRGIRPLHLFLVILASTTFFATAQTDQPDKVVALKAQLEALQIQLDTSNARISRLEQTNAGLQRDLSTARASLAILGPLEGQIEGLKAQLAAERQSNQQFQDRLADEQKTVASLRVDLVQKVGQASEEKQTLQNQLQELQAQLETTQKDLSSTRVDLVEQTGLASEQQQNLQINSKNYKTSSIKNAVTPPPKRKILTRK